MSDQGGCSCVQGISATLCEENIMFWEVSGIGTKVILSHTKSLICPEHTNTLDLGGHGLPLFKER